MKKLILFLSILFAGTYLFSQSIVTQGGLSITTLVEDTLINGCIQVSNVTVNNNGAYGYFRKGNSQFPFQSGIIMASGSISNAQGPNNSGTLGNTISSGSDADLDMLTTSSVQDATIVQFDFIPASDTVTFRYIFGSEEFPEFANTSFNDVFGFFLSGPGINGPYSNNSINIALLPNNQPVTINNVHNFNYYIANPSAGVASSYNNAVQYDGNTIILTATAIVTACETYHIKLAVGDAGDSAYDSGVFLEAGSFISGESISVINSSQVGGEADLWEGCQNYYVISREEGSLAENEVVIDVMVDDGSTATEGTDFNNFPTQVVIPEGQMTDTIFYSAYNDGSDEGHETIIIAFYTACPCGNMSTAVYDTIWIYDAEFIKGGIQDLETFYCGTDAPATLDLVGECNIDPNVDYFWSTGESTSTITIVPQPGATTYYVTMTDICGNEVYDSVTIRVSDMNLSDVTIVPPSCYNECDGYIQLFMEGQYSPYQYRYVNSLYQFFADSIHNTPMSTFGNLCPATYKVTVTDDVGCYQRFEYTLPNPPPIELAVGILNSDADYCVDPGSIELTAETNQPVPLFQWNTSQETASITVTPPIGINDYWVKIFDACGNFIEDHVTIKYSNMDVVITTTDDTGPCNGQANAVVNNGIYPYNYFWLAPIGGFGNPQTGLCFGHYDVQVTDAIGCQRNATGYVEEFEENAVPQSYYDDIFTVFPNPAEDKFVISYKKENYKDINLEITDLKGSVVLKSKMIESSQTIEGIEAGIYFINLYDLEGLVAVQKLVITK
jgi:hypothetical protein